MDILLVRNVVNYIFLSLLSLQDIKEKRVSCLLLFGYLLSGLTYGIVATSLTEMILSLIPGFFLLAISWIFKMEVGLGDVVAIAALGVWNGLNICFYVCAYALLIFDLFVILKIFITKIRKEKVNLKCEIPFIPFILMGMVVCL